MIQISLINFSTLFSDGDLPALANALQLQVTRDFFPIWGVGARIFYTPKGKNPSPDHWPLGLFDDSDQAGVLGFHDVSPTGQPLGKVFVRTTLSDGGLVSVTASHELLEILADPDINLSAQDGSKLWAYEDSDAVEADALGYGITIPAGWNGAGQTIQVSDFITPAWWESFRTTGPFDFKNHLTQPLEIAMGGYMSFLDLNNPSAGWQQIVKDQSPLAQVKARPLPGSRRFRRALPRKYWVRSTYEPDGSGTIASDA